MYSECIPNGEKIVLNRRESDEKSIDRKAMIALSPYYKLQCGGPPVTGARQRVWITQYRTPSGQVRYTYKRDFVRNIEDPQIKELSFDKVLYC
uniref:Uncharacterized protein n=1 Tax=Magallana gigas TaxID=29159 RepID=K1R9U6_MAGGI